jgi:hypothetical protein
VAGRKKRMTMNRAITILRESGWRVDVNKASRRIVLQNPLPDVNWLHIPRKEGVPEGRIDERVCGRHIVPEISRNALGGIPGELLDGGG